MSDSNLDEVFQLVKTFYLAKVGKLSNPKDTIMFLVQELGELSDAITREDSSWDRNNNRDMSVAEELGDILMLLLIMADYYKVDPVKTLKQKMIKKLETLHQ